VVESAKSICFELLSIFIVLDGGFTGNNDLPLNMREGLGDNGNGCRLLVFACDSCKGFVLLAYTSIEVFGPREIFNWVSPDAQGFL
jgi:hypothetical protein